VGEAPAVSDTVVPGIEVTIYFDDDPDDEDTFLLGSREMMALGASKLEIYSPNSPLGAAILGRKIGETASYAAPNGSPIEVTIVAVKPFLG
jgi:transcription elongation factor GreA